ncbi:hypothetical protein NL676_011864 [Syzygium grande]|nr:hypothetical protein NL676_011864 [Syzygium grande]
MFRIQYSMIDMARRVMLADDMLLPRELRVHSARSSVTLGSGGSWGRRGSAAGVRSVRASVYIAAKV